MYCLLRIAGVWVLFGGIFGVGWFLGLGLGRGVWGGGFGEEGCWLLFDGGGSGSGSEILILIVCIEGKALWIGDLIFGGRRGMGEGGVFFVFVMGFYGIIRRDRDV